MKVDFKLAQIAYIADNLRQYKKMWITTEGQMFRSEKDAEEAVRTKNMIIAEPENYVGILEMTSEHATPEIVKAYAKDINKFNDLFKGAKIPKVREQKKEPERKFEAKTEKKLDNDLAQLLNPKVKQSTSVDKE